MLGQPVRRVNHPPGADTFANAEQLAYSGVDPVPLADTVAALYPNDPPVALKVILADDTAAVRQRDCRHPVDSMTWQTMRCRIEAYAAVRAVR